MRNQPHFVGVEELVSSAHPDPALKAKLLKARAKLEAAAAAAAAAAEAGDGKRKEQKKKKKPAVAAGSTKPAQVANGKQAGNPSKHASAGKANSKLPKSDMPNSAKAQRLVNKAAAIGNATDSATQEAPQQKRKLEQGTETGTPKLSKPKPSKM